MSAIEALPYELLQLIAGWLLPRIQCRLSLASKWCYQWLYNDLLKWHAQKAPIKAPRYSIELRSYYGISYLVSILETKDKVIIYDYSYGRLDGINLTTGRIHIRTHRNYTSEYSGDIITLYYYIKHIKAIIHFKCNIHKDLLLLMENVKQPLFILKYEHFDYIGKYLSDHDLKNFKKSHYYIDRILSPIGL